MWQKLNEYMEKVPTPVAYGAGLLVGISLGYVIFGKLSEQKMLPPTVQFIPTRCRDCENRRAENVQPKLIED